MKSDEEMYQLTKQRVMEVLRNAGVPFCDPDNAITIEQSELIIGRDQPYDPREELNYGD